MSCKYRIIECYKSCYCQNVTFVTESKQLTLMKSTLEGIQPADGEVRAENGLHQCQVGVLKLEEITLNRKGKLYNNIIKY